MTTDNLTLAIALTAFEAMQDESFAVFNARSVAEPTTPAWVVASVERFTIEEEVFQLDAERIDQIAYELEMSRWEGEGGAAA